MPVLLARDVEELSLDNSVNDPGILSNIQTPYPNDAMAAIEVSTLVNNRPEAIEVVTGARSTASQCKLTGGPTIGGRPLWHI